MMYVNAATGRFRLPGGRGRGKIAVIFSWSPNMTSETPPLAVHLDEAAQHEVTRLCVLSALLLLQYGAESNLVVGVSTRLGYALGASRVECTLTANSIVLTTVFDGYCITTARRNVDRGVNMTVVSGVQRIMLAAEEGKLDRVGVHEALERVQQQTRVYAPWLVLLLVAVSCACFARLSGGSWEVCALTFAASVCGMRVRQWLGGLHFNAMLVFMATAFVTSLVAGLGLRVQMGNDAHIAMASAVLMLVPGFPLINSLSDVLKGFMNMGIGRWALATVLTLGSSLGIVMALAVLGIDSWTNAAAAPSAPPPDALALVWLLLNDGVFAAIPAVGFALLFNVPPRALKFCAALGALGHGTATVLKLAGITPVFATFFGAALIGTLGVWLAQRYHRAHPKVFTVAAVIPMFPGIPAYKAMLSLVLIEKEGYSPERFAVMVDQFVQTGFLLSALVFGLALPGLLFYRQKPVV
ncbi:threonine/serine exporter ThrE family protein [uncultured Cardiobacterium sp.]|uniref:threonine/serine ThrE exporter family protein n=1 Tax=uncultured Cardiobacterium sp. TaxID=417619 RepID=UPI0026272315|nr:threonine/serine exporter family protein [uncultured Cardiobacterium sp.]